MPKKKLVLFIGGPLGGQRVAVAEQDRTVVSEYTRYNRAEWMNPHGKIPGTVYIHRETWCDQSEAEGPSS